MLAALLGAACAVRVLAEPRGLAMPRDGVEWELRLLRVASGLSVGAALAVAGVLLQALLRNPLAAPSILGLTSGASLGVTVWMYAGYLATGAIVQHRPPVLAALAGSLGALAIVYTLAQKRGLIDPLRLILVGVVVSIICGAGSNLVMHLMPDRGVAMAARWLLGSLHDDVGWVWALGIGGATLCAVAVSAWAGPAMDAASLGDEEAASVGVPLPGLRVSLYFLSGALTAGTVALAGPIGFVGLICPHAVRLIAGPSHRALVVGSALAGGALLVGADALVRVVDFGAGRVPIGVLTTLVGGPVFLLLLRKRVLLSP